MTYVLNSTSTTWVVAYGMNTPQSVSTPIKKTEKQFREELEALAQKSSALNERRIRIQAEIERARQEKDELEKSLMEEFKTCDLKELARELSKRELANEDALSTYRQRIELLSTEIDAVSAKLNAAK